jgi:inward rectifier potassium channel
MSSLRNRWFDRPTLHRSVRGRRFSWLELFHDLVAGSALVALGDALSRNPSTDAFVTFAVTFSAIWLTWTAFTFYQNRFFADDLAHRLLVLVKLVAVGALGLAAPRVMQGDTRSFSLGYTVVQLALALLYARARGSVTEARSLSGHYAIVHLLNAGVWLAAAFTEGRFTWGLWAIGIGLGFSFPVNRRSRQLALEHPPDVPHMTERYGLLTLVLLGLGLGSVLRALAGHQDAHALVAASLAVLLVFCLFWLYFDDVGGSSIKGERGAPFVWVYSHLPLSLGLAGALSGVRSIAGAEASGPPSEGSRWLVAGGLSLSLLAMALIDSVTVRKHVELGDRARVNARIGAAFLALLVAPIGASMNAIEFLALAAAPCVAQVVFDLMMAPLVARLSEGAEVTTEIATRVPEPERPSSAPRRPARPTEAIRRGTPNELRRDLYFLFMEGPWSRLVLSLVFLYLTVNVVFAALYLLEPGAIANARPGSFADAFFFSVQTFATIGYGGLSPASAYGNMIVTTEAAVSLLSTAVATGLMFAKAARPRSSTLFSRVMVVGPRNGVPTLMFRVGNARGNDVVDATVSVTALKEDVSLEGHRMRRLHDVPLLRNRSPIFTMTWSVLHEIGPDSPFAGVDWADPKGLVAIIVTLMGHDGTYGQTTYGRHIYYPENVREGHRFVDVTSQLDDGRLVVDYEKFHDTTPDAALLSRSDPPSMG